MQTRSQSKQLQEILQNHNMSESDSSVRTSNVSGQKRHEIFHDIEDNDEQPPLKKRRVVAEAKQSQSKSETNDSLLILNDIDSRNFQFGIWQYVMKQYNLMMPDNQIYPNTSFEEQCYNIFSLSHLILLYNLHFRFQRRTKWQMPPWLAKHMLFEHIYLLMEIQNQDKTKFTTPFDPWIMSHMHKYVLTIIPHIEQYNLNFGGHGGVDYCNDLIDLESNFYISLNNACKGNIIPTFYAWNAKQCVQMSEISSEDIANVIFKYCSLDLYLMSSYVPLVCKSIQHLSSLIVKLVIDSTNFATCADFFNAITVLFCSKQKSENKNGNNDHDNINSEYMPILQSSFYNLFIGFNAIMCEIGQLCSSDDNSNIFGIDCQHDDNLYRQVSDLCRIYECLFANKTQQSIESGIAGLSEFAGLTSKGKNQMQQETVSDCTLNMKYLIQSNGPLNKYGVSFTSLVDWVAQMVENVLKERLFFIDCLRSDLNAITKDLNDSTVLIKLLETKPHKIDDVCVKCETFIQGVENVILQQSIRDWYYIVRFIKGLRFVNSDRLLSIDTNIAFFMIINGLKLLEKQILKQMMHKKGLPAEYRTGIFAVGGEDVQQVFAQCITYSLGLFAIICQISYVDESIYQSIFWKELKSNVSCISKFQAMILAVPIVKQLSRENPSYHECHKISLLSCLHAFKQIYTFKSNKSFEVKDCILNKIFNLLHFTLLRNGCNIAASYQNVINVDKVDIALSLSHTHLQSSLSQSKIDTNNNTDVNTMSLVDFSRKQVSSTARVLDIDKRDNISRSKRKTKKVATKSKRTLKTSNKNKNKNKPTSSKTRKKKNSTTSPSNKTKHRSVDNDDNIDDSEYTQDETVDNNNENEQTPKKDNHIRIHQSPELNPKQQFQQIIRKYLKYNVSFGRNVQQCQVVLFQEPMKLFQENLYQRRLDNASQQLQKIKSMLMNVIANKYWHKQNALKKNNDGVENMLHGINLESNNPAGILLNKDINQQHRQLNDSNNDNQNLNPIQRWQTQFTKAKDHVTKLKILYTWVMFVFNQMKQDKVKIADSIQEMANDKTRHYKYLMLMLRLGLIDSSQLNNIDKNYDCMMKIVESYVFCVFFTSSLSLKHWMHIGLLFLYCIFCFMEISKQCNKMDIGANFKVKKNSKCQTWLSIGYTLKYSMLFVGLVPTIQLYFQSSKYHEKFGDKLLCQALSKVAVDGQNLQSYFFDVCDSEDSIPLVNQLTMMNQDQKWEKNILEEIRIPHEANDNQEKDNQENDNQQNNNQENVNNDDNDIDIDIVNNQALAASSNNNAQN